MPTTTESPKAAQVGTLLSQLTVLVAALTPRPVEESRDHDEYRRQADVANALVNGVEQALLDRVTGQFETFIKKAFQPDMQLMRDLLMTYNVHTGNLGSDQGLLNGIAHILQRDGLDAILCSQQEGKTLRSLLSLIQSGHWLGTFFETLEHVVVTEGVNPSPKKVQHCYEMAWELYEGRRQAAQEFIERYGEAALAAK